MGLIIPQLRRYFLGGLGPLDSHESINQSINQSNKQNKHYKWPKIHGFYSGYVTPEISGASSGGRQVVYTDVALDPYNSLGVGREALNPTRWGFAAFFGRRKCV